MQTHPYIMKYRDLLNHKRMTPYPILGQLKPTHIKQVSVISI